MESKKDHLGEMAGVAIHDDEKIMELQYEINRLKKREERLLHLISNIPVGVALSTSEKKKYFFNAALMSFLGRQDSTGQYEDSLELVQKYSHPDDLVEEIVLIENQLAEKPDFLKYSFIKRYRIPGEKEKTARLNVMRYLDNEKDNYLGLAILEDLTEWKQNEKVLTNVKDIFTSLFSNSSDAFIITDINGNIEDVSGSMVQLFLGDKSADFIGKSALTFIFSPDLFKSRKAILRLIRNKKINPIDVRLMRKDGSLIYGNITATLLHNNKGQGIGFGLIIRDVTDIRSATIALSIAQEKYRALAENSPDIIMRFDKGYKHLYVNQAIQSVFNVQPSHFVGKTHEEIGFSKEQCDFWHAAIQTVFDTAKPYVTSFELETPKGVVDFEWHLGPEFDKEGAVTSVLTLARDISISKKADKQNARILKEQRLLADLSQILLPGGNYEQNFEKGLGLLGRFLKVNRVVIYSYDYQKEIMKQRYIWLREGTTLPESRLTEIPKIRKEHEMLERGEFLLFEDTSVTEPDLKAFFEIMGITGFCGVPMFLNDRLYGMITFVNNTSGGGFENLNMEYLSTVSSLITTALERIEIEQQLITSQSLYKLLASGIPGTDICLFDSDLKLLVAEGSNFAGLSKMKGASLEMFIPDSLQKVFSAEIAHVLKGQKRIFQFDFEHRWFTAQILPISLQQSPDMLILAVVRDITSEKKASETIDLQNEALMSINEQLKSANAALHESNVSKDRFFNVIAHDLKNPLNAILGFCELLDENYLNYTDEDIMRMLGNISRAGHSTYRLLENLLEWSRLQTGNLRYMCDFHNLRLLVEESVYQVSAMSSKKNITININIQKEKQLFCDQYLITAVLRNLISNALKFTPKAGVISIDYEENEAWSLVKVVDNGVGMSIKNQERLFRMEDFYSAPGTENEKGTGLGLLLVKEIILLHKGEVGFNSKENEGSTFWFKIPSSNPLPD